jgi:hypothetical protein
MAKNIWNIANHTAFSSIVEGALTIQVTLPSVVPIPCLSPNFFRVCLYTSYNALPYWSSSAKWLKEGCIVLIHFLPLNQVLAIEEP